MWWLQISFVADDNAINLTLFWWEWDEGWQLVPTSGKFA